MNLSKSHKVLLVCITLLIFITIQVKSATYYLVGANPQTPNNWNTVADGSGVNAADFTTAGDVFIIDDDAATLGGNTTFGANVHLQINAGASLNMSNRTFTVGGTTTIDGTLSDNNNGGTNTFTGLVTVNATGTISTGNNSNFVFQGGLTNNGGTVSIAGGVGSITFNTNNQSIGGNTLISFGVNRSIVVTGITVTNNNTAGVEILRPNAGALSGTGGWTQGVNSILTYHSSTLTVTTVDFTANGNTVNYARNNTQTIRNTTYFTLVVSGGSTKTLGGAVTLTNLEINTNNTILECDVYQITGNATGTITMTGTSTLRLGNPASSTNVLFPTNFVTGNISLTSGTVAYQALTAQDISATPVYNNLYINNTGVLLASVVGGASASTSLTVNGFLTVNNANNTLDLGTTITTANVTGVSTINGTLLFNGTTTKTVTLAGNLTASGTVDMSGGSLLHTLNLGGATNTCATFTTAAVASTVNYNAGGNQTVFPSMNYRNLTLSNSGTKTMTMTANAAAGGILTVASGVTFTLAGAFTFDVSGNSIIAGTFGSNNTGATINLQDVNLSGGQLGVGVTSTINILGNLTMPTGDGILQRSNITVSGSTTIATGRTLTLNNNEGVKTFESIIDVQGTGVFNSSAITTAGRLIVQNGISNNNDFTSNVITFNTNSQNLTGSGTYTFAGNVLVSGAITVTNQCSNVLGISISSVLNGDDPASTWRNDPNTKLFYANAAAPMATGILDVSANNNLVEYNRNNNQTVKEPLTTYYHLSFTNAGTKTLTLTANSGIDGDLIVSSGVIGTITGAFSFDVAGTSTIAGTFAPGNAATIINLQDVNASSGQLGNGVTGTININGNLTFPTADATLERSDINITNPVTIITGRTLYLTSATGLKRFDGLLTVQAGGTFAANVSQAPAVNSTSTSLEFRGGVSNEGTFQAGGANFSTANQNLSGSAQYHFTGALVITGAITVTNQSTHVSGIELTSTLNGTDVLSTWRNDPNTKLFYGNATQPMATGVLDVSANNNLVEYNSTGNQTVKEPLTTYYHLSFTTGGIKTLTLTANSGIDGDFIVSTGVTGRIDGAFTFDVAGSSTIAGTMGPRNVATIVNLQDVDLSGGQLGNGVTGTINITGTLSLPTADAILERSSININGPATQVLAGRTLTLNNNNGIKTFANALDIAATGTFTSTAVTTTGNLVFQNGIINQGDFVAGGITFNTNSQSVSGAGTYTINNATLIDGAITVTNLCTHPSGIVFQNTLNGNDPASTWLQGNNSVLTFNNATIPFATSGVLDAYTPAETNTVYYGANNNIIYRGNEYYNITLSGTGIAVLSTSATTVHGTLTVQTASLNNTAGILIMEDDATINRYNDVSLSNIPTFNGVINIIYTGGNLTTGVEMPVASNVLQDLTINVAGLTVTLGANVTCNGICTLTDGVLSIGNFDFTLEVDASISGVYDATHMIACDGTGKFIKKGNVAADFVMTYPVGTGVLYSPMIITSFSGTLGASPQISVLPKTPAHPLTLAPTPYNALLKYWTVETTDLTGVNANVSFYYNDAELFGDENNYEPRSIYTAAFNVVPGPSVNTAGNFFSSTGADETDLNGDWTCIDPAPAIPRSWYSYQNGDWADPLTWTLTIGLFDNPDLLVPSELAIDDITIQTGHTVYTAIDRTVSSTHLEANGKLDIQDNIASNLGTITGTGTLAINTFALPTGDFTAFVASGGGTVEYYDVPSGSLPTSVTTYCNLLLSNSTAGNLTYTFDNPLNPTTYTLNGDLTTTNTGAGDLTVTLGNVITNPIQLNVAGTLTNGAGCTFNCVNLNAIHTITCSGDLINNGTFDVANNAAYSNATTGAAHVVFTGLSNNVFTCNGTTEVYSLTLNKGTDQTYELLLSAPTGSFSFTTNGASGADGIVMTNGTLTLGSGITLTRIRGSNNNFNVSSAANNNACLKIDGATVTSNYTCNVYGKFWMVSGNCTMGNNGLNLQNGSEFVMDGGTLTVERLINGGGGTTVATVTINGGTLNVNNSPANAGVNDLPRVSFASPFVTFIQTGGTVNVSNPVNMANCSNGGIIIRSDIGNYSVTGGTWNIYIPALSTARDNFYITSTVPFYDLNVYSSGVGTCVAKLETIGGEVVSVAQPMVVLRDFTIGNGTDAPVFDANGLAVTVGGNFTINMGANFNSNKNTLTINGPQTLGRTNQTITLNNTVSNAVDLVINKSTGTATLAGTGNFQYLRSLTISSGTFNDGGKTLDVVGDILNSGVHEGAGAIRVQRGVRSTSGVAASTYDLPTITSSTGPAPTTHATFNLTIENGVVTNISIANGGAGYGGGQFHNLVVAGGNGVGLECRAERAGGALIGVWIVDGGSGYGPTATDAGDGGGAGALFEAVVTGTTSNVAGTGTLTSVEVLSTGEGYTNDCTVDISANGATPATSCVGETDTAPNIGGSGSGTFTNFSLNNDITGGGAILTANQTINGNLRLLNGVLDINSYRLTLSATTNIYSDAAVGTTFSNTKMIKTNGLSSASGVVKTFNATNFTFPIGSSNKYTPGSITFSSAPTSYGSITMKPVDSEHPLVSAAGQSLTYYWKVSSVGFTLGAATVTQTFTYDDADIVDNAIDILESEYVPGRFDFTTVQWTSNSDMAKVDEASNTITFDGVDFNTQIDGDFTAGDQTPDDPFSVVLTFYSRDGSVYDWDDIDTWSTTGHNGLIAGILPTNNSIVRIGDGVTYNHTVTVDADGQESGSLLIANGSTLNIGNTIGHNFGVYVSPASGNGTLRISSANATADFPAGDFTDFLGTTGGTVEYYTTAGQNFAIPSVSDAPSSINLINYYNISLTPEAGAYIEMPDINLTVYNDITVQGADATAVVRLNTASAKNLVVENDLLVNSGNLQFRNGIAQAITIENDVIVETGAVFDLENAGATANTMSILGSLEVNGTGVFDMVQSSTCALTFSGTSNEFITGSGGTIELHTVSINKGTTQAPVLEVDFAGTFTVPTTYDWLTLTNGTFRWNKTGGTLNISNNTVRSDFYIPATACLSIGANATELNVVYFNNNTARDVFLTGKIEVLGGTLNVGSSIRNSHCDIEIDQVGQQEIDVQGNGVLFVNGAIRRRTTTASGSLVYTQSDNSQVIIAGRTNTNLTRGKLEICNAGSSFNMSDNAILEIRRGGGTDGTFGDLYLAPALASSVGSNTEIRFAPANIGSNETFGLNTSMNLANITVNGMDANDLATVQLLVNALTLTGNLTISDEFSVFNANSFNVNIAGNLSNLNTDASTGINVGGYRAGSATQVTTFNSSSSAQTITGTATPNITNFGRLVINNAFGTVTLDANTEIRVNDNITISTALNVGANTASVVGNVTINASQTGSGKIYLVGTSPQTITGSGSFTNLDLNNTSGTDVAVLSNTNINGVLTLSNGKLNIANYQLTFGASAGAVVGASSTRFIRSNGSLTDAGVRKAYSDGVGTSVNFTFPIGVGNNYRPATFTGTATTASGYLNVVQVNVKHPSTQDAANTELTTYWAISTSGMSDISVTHQYTYVDGDVQSDENLYVTGRFDQDVLDWSPGLGGEAGTSVTPASNLLTWTTKTYLDGDYTAGYTDEFEALAIYYSRNSTSGGNWSDPNSWSTDPVLQHDGAPALVAPNGNQLFIASGHTITIDGHSKRGSIVNLLGTLDCQAFIGHIFKEIEGTGVLSLNATGGGSFVLPTAIITDFVSATGGTVRFAGTNNGSLPAAQTQYNEMVFDGAFTKTLPPVNLTVLGDITIENTVGNVVNHPSNTLTLYGNWTNNRGASGYTSAAGTINMINSTAVRDITGVTTFRNLTINNTFATAPQVTVNSPITVQGTLTLTSGVVQTDAVNIITLANGATTGIGSASAYIDGPMAVTKASVGVTNFNFPIGKLDEYRPAQLSVTHSDVASTIYTAEMLPGNANDLGYTLPGTLEHVSYTRFWDISKTGAGTVTGATVRLYYSSTGTNDEVFDAPNLAVAKTNDLYTDWVDLNGTATGNNNGSILSGSFTTFSLFTLANKVGGGNPLPVDLLYVKAKKQENNVLVQWATASEINQSHFEIERSSDGKNFNYIGAVYSSQSHSSQLKSYDFIDQNPQTGINYYRLKQVDLDGQFIYSNMVYVIYDDISSFKHNNFFTLYPNPVKHDQLIHVQSTNTNQSIKEVTVMLVDIHGKAYLTDVLLTDIDGGFYYAISIDKTIPPGTYMIIASTSEMYEAQKIIIQ